MDTGIQHHALAWNNAYFGAAPAVAGFGPDSSPVELGCLKVRGEGDMRVLGRLRICSGPGVANSLFVLECTRLKESLRLMVPFLFSPFFPAMEELIVELRLFLELLDHEYLTSTVREKKAVLTNILLRMQSAKGESLVQIPRFPNPLEFHLVSKLYSFVLFQ